MCSVGTAPEDARRGAQCAGLSRYQATDGSVAEGTMNDNIKRLCAEFLHYEDIRLRFGVKP